MRSRRFPYGFFLAIMLVTMHVGENAFAAIASPRSMTINVTWEPGPTTTPAKMSVFANCYSVERGWFSHAFRDLPIPSTTNVTFTEYPNASCTTGVQSLTATLPPGQLWKTPTVTPNEFTVLEGDAIPTISIVQGLTASDATVALRLTILNGPAEPFNVPFSGSCYKPGVLTPIASGVRHIATGVTTELGSIVSGAYCSFSLNLGPTPRGFLWKVGSNNPHKTMTATVGANVVTYELELIPASEVVFKMIPSGINGGASWEMSADVLCDGSQPYINSSSYSFGNGYDSHTIKIPIGTSCTLTPRWTGILTDSRIPALSARAPVAVLAKETEQLVNILLPYVPAGQLFVKKTAVDENGTPTVPPAANVAVECVESGVRVGSTATFDFTQPSETKDLGYWPVGVTCDWKLVHPNGVIQASGLPTYTHFAEQATQITVAQWDNSINARFARRRAGTLALSVAPNTGVPNDAVFSFSLSCELPPSLLWPGHGEPFAYPTTRNVQVGATAAIENIPAGSVCAIEFFTNTNPSAYGPATLSHREVTVVSGQTIAVSARPEPAQMVSVTLLLTGSDAASNLVSSGSVSATCRSSNGGISTHEAIVDTDFLPKVARFFGLPAGATCTPKMDQRFRYAVSSPETFSLPALAGSDVAVNLTVFARPYVQAEVTVKEEGNGTLANYFAPTLLCAIDGKTARYTYQSNSVVGAGEQRFGFDRVPLGALCIGSLRGTEPNSHANNFAFSGFPQQFTATNNFNFLTLKAQVVAATSYSLFVSVQGGILSGSTTVRTDCSMSSGTAEGWASSQSGVAISGWATVLNVPSGAKCTATVASEDLPRLGASESWTRSSFQSQPFEPSANGSTQVLLSLSVARARDHDNILAIPTLSSWLVGLLSIGILLVAHRPCARKIRY